MCIIPSPLVHLLEPELDPVLCLSAAVLSTSAHSHKLCNGSHSCQSNPVPGSGGRDRSSLSVPIKQHRSDKVYRCATIASTGGTPRRGARNASEDPRRGGYHCTEQASITFVILKEKEIYITSALTVFAQH